MNDVIIVGAGPAGCSLANLVSKAGFKVTVFDALPNECTHFCGELINIKDAEKNTQIKFSKDLLLNKYKNAELIFADTGKVIPVPWKNVYLVNTQRLKTKLRKKAESQGAKFIFNKRISSIIKKQGIVIGVKAGNKKYFSKIVAVCDGSNSKVARLAGFDCSTNKVTPSFRWKYKNCKNLDTKSARFYFYEKLGMGYAWLYPINKTKCNVGIGSVNPEHIYEIFKELVKTEPALKNAKVYHKGAGTITYTGVLPKISLPGCIVVGEAAGQMHSLTGGGVNPALFAAKLASEVVITALKNNSYATGGLYKYDVLYRKSRDGVVIKRATKGVAKTIKLHKRKNVVTLLARLMDLIDPKIIKRGSMGNLTIFDKLSIFFKHPIKFTQLAIEVLT